MGYRVSKTITNPQKVCVQRLKCELNLCGGAHLKKRKEEKRELKDSKLLNLAWGSGSVL